MTQLDLDTPDARRGAEADANAPLAELLRPKDLADYKYCLYLNRERLFYHIKPLSYLLQF